VGTEPNFSDFDLPGTDRILAGISHKFVAASPIRHLAPMSSQLRACYN
jgi:hypothetical protein